MSVSKSRRKRTGRVMGPAQTGFRGDFWQGPSLEELAERQGVKPLHDVESLFGTWPGDVDDGFEEDIERLRKADVAGDRQG